MAKIDVKRDVTVTMTLTEDEAKVLCTLLQHVSGDRREICSISNALHTAGVGYTGIEGLTGSIKWNEVIL